MGRSPLKDRLHGQCVEILEDNGKAMDPKNFVVSLSDARRAPLSFGTTLLPASAPDGAGAAAARWLAPPPRDDVIDGAAPPSKSVVRGS